MVNILTVFAKIWQMGQVKHFFWTKKTTLFFPTQLNFNFFVFLTVVDPNWNDNRRTMRIKTVSDPGLEFVFFNNVLCVNANDAENQELT